MAGLHTRSRCLALAVVALSSGVTALSAPPQGRAPADPGSARESVAVIVNKDNPQTSLTPGDLRRMMLGEMTRWPDGRRLTVVMREPGAAERSAVLRLICRMSEADFSRHLLYAAYRGDSQTAPKQLDTSMGVRRFIFNVPGAIGYVRSDEVDDSVKILLTIRTE